MRRDLDALVAYVRGLSYLSTTEISDADLELYVNEGVDAVSVAYPWPFLYGVNTFTAVEGDATPLEDVLATDDDLYKILDVSPLAGKPRLRPISFQQMSAMYGDDLPSSSKAQYFYTQGSDLWLVPLPDDDSTEYKIHYLRTAATLTGANAPEWDVQWHLLPAYHALMRVWEREEDLDRAEMWRQTFYSNLERMAAWYLRNTRVSPLIYGQPPATAGTASNTPWMDGL